MGILGYMLSFFSIFLFLFRVGRGIDGLTEGLRKNCSRGFPSVPTLTREPRNSTETLRITSA
ncbi:unnamed protein product [Tuber melanosporum]|uniref:(Perigord truffle) hypothetical protein n=1 Tax=Tuber melanosporum (strain Mel28) TaxID=656061 RepID=D5GBT0_TUBMM|nr:uncharacterized protein GSTUM_00005566001 [Tuber melanosporum]CAZ81930.1 unnamed protein product [Tuber melanosporum]